MIISQNSNDVYYAYTRGRFWRWDESAQVWKESHLLAQKFDKAKAAEKHLTPEAFLTSDELVSLETPIGEEEDSHLGDFIQDESIPTPVEATNQTLLHEQLDEVVSTLTEREQRVIKLRFGWDDGRPRTLEEVGKEFNVTRERIRQIEAKALRKLRHPNRSRKLKDFLYN